MGSDDTKNGKLAGQETPAGVTKSESQEVVLFAPMGSDPGLLLAMVWALRRHHNLRVAEAYVVLVDKGAHYVNKELLPPQQGLDELHEMLGPECLPREHLCLRIASRDGVAVKDALRGADAEAYQDEVVQVAIEAIESAGERPVVFALLAGRRRTMTVMASMVAQFFARPQDRLMDLRVEDEPAGVPVCFFFPEDGEELHGITMPSSGPQVSLVDIRVPRLRPLLFAKCQPNSYEELLSLGQEAVDRAAHPLSLEVRLVDDGGSRGAFVHDTLNDVRIELDLTKPQLLYLASLIEGRRDSEDGFVQVGNALSSELSFATLVRSIPWAKRYAAVRAFVGPGLSTVDEIARANKTLDEMRARTRKELDDLAAGQDVRYEELKLKHENRNGESFWALPLQNAKVVK